MYYYIIDLVHCNTRSSVAQNTTLVMIYKSQSFICGFSINNRMCSKLYTGFATGMFNIEAHIATLARFCVQTFVATKFFLSDI